MFRRQTSGSVVCVSCGYLVGVKDDRCYHCGRRNPALFGFAPALRSLGHDAGFVPLVTGICVVVYLLSVAVGGVAEGGGLLGFLSPGPVGTFLLGESGYVPVVGLHRWWTVLSAMWLHGGLLHLLMNMYGLRQLAPGVAELYGPGRMVIIYVLGSVVGFTVSSLAGVFFSGFPPPLAPGGFTIGASAALFALIGALLYYGNRSGSRWVHATAKSWAISAFIFGLIIPGIDNYAHAGGFVGGYLVGRILDPLRQEQINHILIGLMLIVVSLLAVIVSVIHGRPLVPLIFG
ncbi:MAG TPA: rhomboid family intramembrane serine protease [Vicinamibacterales bacterium]|nr:rhomboid family intramembrane serine protease [Vicinamibacterales bacterium]